MERISILDATRQLGRSKSTVKYWVQKLPPETVSKDESGRLWLSPDGLEQLRERLAAEPVKPDFRPDEHNHQEPDEKNTRFSAEPPKTGRKPDEKPLSTGQKLDETGLSTGQQPDENSTLTGQKLDENHFRPDETGRKPDEPAQLDALREQLERLRGDLYAERQRAAVAAAERDAERRRADAAELREQQQAQTVKDLTAALQTAQQQAAALTDALTAAQALHAGTLRGQLETHDTDPAAMPTAAAEPAPDLTGTQTGGDGAHDQSKGRRRGFFARLFGKR